MSAPLLHTVFALVLHVSGGRAAILRRRASGELGAMTVRGAERPGRRLLLLGAMHSTMTLCMADDGDQSNGCIIGNNCPQGTNWVNLWYVWLILVTIFLLLLCGTTASCIKFCCKKKKPPVQTLPNHPYEVTVIAIDNDSTIHSTVTSYSSVQYPHMFAFGDPDRSTLSPPAYSLYALELPPAYEEAIKMAKPSNEVGTSAAGPKLEDITENEGPEEEPEQQAVSSVTDSPPQYEETEDTSHAQ